ncbi:hypothetical protein DVT68_00270 [Dyella solisilvae]|uniref:Integrase catalytic domain-containing protein n=1 Tax=Dyella solisilvae TaxID=1920168 RepID=A0A370KA79_9GAMM|nr:hypothetical protein [Dyella solisilvae]RDI99337.1 hypothetical protein DVT68_00270 [Dyella solisilvae]
MIARFTEQEVKTLLALPRPDTKAMADDAERRAVDNRVAALVELIHGAPVKAVATRYRLHRKTLRRMLRLVSQPGLDGSLMGFSVCIPGLRLVDLRPRITGIPESGHAHAMTRLVEAIPELHQLIMRFTGALPARTQTSPAFDRLYKDMKRALKAAGLEQHYPLTTRDQGRRALSTFINRERTRRAEIAMTHAAPPKLTRLSDLLTIEPFDEVQFDAHWIDAKGLVVAVPLADGTYTRSPISGLWLLAKVDAGSRCCMAWSLVVGPSYDELDLLRTLASSLLPWQPRNLRGLRLAYLPNAWMPSAEGLPPRPLQSSMDNFSAHIAKHARRTMLNYQLGIYHFGVSGIPETRAVIEAFFKRMEEEVLRFLAGGFEPATKDRTEQRVSSRRASDYPVFLDLLENFVDVAITTYNVSPNGQMNNRSPREIIERFISGGGLVLRSTRSAMDARDLTRFRVEVTVRGSKKTGVLPHVNYGYATYRSEKLNARWDLIGRSFHGYVDDGDARILQLLDEAGLPYVTLHALPPYARTPHTLEMRRRAEQWRRGRRTGLQGIDDAIEAYHADVRERARSMKWAADAVASGAVPAASRTGKSAPSLAADSLGGLPPRGGPVRLR